MKRIFLLFLLYLLPFFTRAQDNMYVQTMFDEEHRAMLGNLKNYRFHLFFYQRTQKQIAWCKSTNDSLRTIVQSSRLHKKEKDVLYYILDSCMNDKKLDDVPAQINKLDTTQRNRLNKTIAIDFLDILNTKVCETFMYSDVSYTWAKWVYKFSYGNAIGYYDAQKHLLPDSVFQHEINQYQFKPGETIADIGAGSAYFERALSTYSDSLTVYVTEIDSQAVSVMEVKLTLLDSTDRKSITFISVLGGTESTGLSKVKMDKVLIRNTFHHFSNPDAMLQDIKASLKKNGSLYIVDVMLNETKNTPACSKHFTREIFMNYMMRNGFVLINEIPLQYDEFILFEFKITE